MVKETIPSQIQAMGFTEAKSDVTLITYKLKPLGKYDADIRITYNGICHSDVHMIDNDWGMSRYPLVPGHEIVGHVVGPLMWCAGITVYDPLISYLNGENGVGKTIGIMGIGGLGHVAIQFALKMGANKIIQSSGCNKSHVVNVPSFDPPIF